MRRPLGHPGRSSQRVQIQGWRQIGGELRILPGDNGRSTRVTVKF